MSLPYTMGNSGDLLKHGVLAEFVRWQCELGRSFRFFDLFGGEPEQDLKADRTGDRDFTRTQQRVRALPDCALRAVQIGINEGRYFGSGVVARNAATNVSCGAIQVLTSDCDSERRERLRAAGLTILDEEFPRCRAGADRYDAYAAFGEIVPILKDDDLVLLDPFREFLLHKARTVVPQVATAVRRAAVLLFALNLNPNNRVGRNFDALLEQHLPGAWRMTCPPVKGGVKGESKYHADVVLIARPLVERDNSRDVQLLRRRLTDYTKHLAGVLGMPERQLELRVVGR